MAKYFILYPYMTTYKVRKDTLSEPEYSYDSMGLSDEMVDLVKISVRDKKSYLPSEFRIIDARKFHICDQFIFWQLVICDRETNEGKQILSLFVE